MSFKQRFENDRCIGHWTAHVREDQFVSAHLEETDDCEQLYIPDVFSTTVTAIRERDDIGDATLSNLYNVVHDATHILACGNTKCADERFGFDIQGTHGLFSEFSWSGESR